MKSLKILSSVFLLIFTNATSALSQAKGKRDTLYYLYNPKNTTASDRMISTVIESTQKIYIIHCPCLQKGGFPIFTADTLKRIAMAKEEVKNVSCISLTALIEKVKQSSNSDQFISDHALYFVEGDKKKTKLKVYQMEDKREVVE